MPKAQQISVLLVEDQQSMRQLARYALEQMGIQDVVEAKNGREAITQLSNRPFDLILSDWNMDEVDGLTLLKVVRGHPSTKELPFIMATGQSDVEQVRKAIATGVNNYVVKPFDTATLRKKIEAVIGAIT